MTDSEGISERWSSGSLEDYLDVDSGVPVAPAERLSTMNGEDHAAALDVLTRRMADLVGALDDHEVLELGARAVDDLYRAGTTLPMWSPDVAAYVRAVWGTLLSSVRGRGYRVMYVVNDAYTERIGRPLELYPDLFTAAGVTYVCPHALANQLPAAHDAEVTSEGLEPFAAEGRELALAEVKQAMVARQHVAYVEISGSPETVAPVVALAEQPGTVGVVRVGAPGPDNPPAVAVMARV